VEAAEILSTFILELSIDPRSVSAVNEKYAERVLKTPTDIIGIKSINHQRISLALRV